MTEFLIVFLVYKSDDVVEVSARGQFNEEEFNLDGDLGSLRAFISHDPLPFNVRAWAFGSRLNLTGTLNLQENTSDLDAAVTLQGDRLEETIANLSHNLTIGHFFKFFSHTKFYEYNMLINTCYLDL